jgi:hypothetical protein
MLPPPRWGELSPSRRWVAAIVVVLLLLPILALRMAYVFFDKHGTFRPGPALVIIVVTAVAFLVNARSMKEDARRRSWRHRRRSRPARLGEDGIALGDDEFVRWDAVASSERQDGLLVLHAGRAEAIVLSIEPNDWLETEGLLERGRSSAGGSRRDDDLEGTLRQGTSAEAPWLARIGALGECGSYRVPGVDRARLWTLALDAYADPSARRAACMLLKHAHDDDERRTLRASLAVTAHPRVRAAMAAALGE